DDNANLREELRNLHAKVAKKLRMDLNFNNCIKGVDKGNEFFHGKYNDVDALIEKAKSGPEVRKIVEKLRCGKTLRDYISDRNTRYEDMSVAIRDIIVEGLTTSFLSKVNMMVITLPTKKRTDVGMV
ncbi:hypothetical protein Tco_0159354, partial [Tanacetum coccineum]